MKKILLAIPYSIEVSGTLIFAMPFCQALRDAGCDARVYCVANEATVRAGNATYDEDWQCVFQSPDRLMDAIENGEEQFDLVFWLGVYREDQLRRRQVNWCVKQKQSGESKIALLWERTGHDVVIPEVDLLVKTIDEGVDHLCVLNESQRSQLLEKSVAPELLSMFSIGIDTLGRYVVPQPERSLALKRDFGWLQSDTVMLVLARFVPRKRIEFVMKTWLETPALWANARLVVAGSGFGAPDSTEPEIEELAARHPSISFVKYREGLDTVALYHAADVYITASRFEGEPKSVVEAMACGLPVIASQIPGHESIVQHGRTGLLFQTDSCRELAASLMRFRDDSEERRLMSKEARYEVAENRDIQHIAERFLRMVKSRKRNRDAKIPQLPETAIPDSFNLTPSVASSANL